MCKLLIMINLKDEKSPFLFGKTVDDTGFINRTKDIELLWLNMRSSINTILLSPRRWGKSSLVKHIAHLKRNDKNVRFCFIDMFAIRDEAGFYEALSKALLQSTSTKWEDWVNSSKSFFKQVMPKISMGIDPTHDFSISFEWDEVEKHKDEILNLPERIAQKHKVQLIVCIDEFQNIHNFNDSESFEKLLRSYWQHHKHVSYCLYGSKRTLMADIFNKKNRAFYRFGDIIQLEKIATEHWVPFIVEQFKKTGKKISLELAKDIVILMKNHSYYVQQLSHYVWAYTSKEATDYIIEEALVRMLQVNQAFYQYEVESLSNTQVNLIKAIVDGVEQLTAMKTMQQYNIGTPRNISKNIKALEKHDFVEKIDKKVFLIDPAFELWFRRFYMGKRW